jgi:hypothetical protein
MLLVGRQDQRTCQGWTRRAFLQAGGSAVLGLTLADLLRWQAQGAAGHGTARSVIFVWLWGGPSHIDMWDPKPNAPLEYRGPYQAAETKVPGIRISELFPQLADLADQFSIVRSLHTASNDHGVAGTIGLTGSMTGAVDLGGKALGGSARPATGAIVARAKGFKSALPPYLVVGGRLHQGKKSIIGEGGGTLGALYDPFRLDYEPGKGVQVPALQLSPGLSPERLGDRQQLLKAFDRLQQDTDRLHGARALDDYRSQAFALLTSPASQKAFDLSGEPANLLERYGRTRFGYSCVLARRLAEKGVPFVQVNWSDHVEAEEDGGDGGWDCHYRLFQVLQDRQGPMLDQALAALLTDLRERGMLASTMVVVVGEFGRTPRITDREAGRDHWPGCFSALVAGGGVAGGRLIGSSTSRGEQPRDYPVTPADLAATIHQAVGINAETAATLGLNNGGKVIEQLF